jgi:hypothetical protein
MKPILLLFLSLLTGCVTTAPRQAEVTIPAPAAKVRAAAVAFLLAQDWRPVRSDDLVMVFEKAGRTSDILLVDSSARQELTLSILDAAGSTRLMGFGAHLYHMGRRTHNDIEPGVMWHLEGIRATVAGAPIPAPPAPVMTPAKPTKGA